MHGVTKSRTRLSDFTFTFHFHALEKEMATHSVFLPGESRDGGAWWAAVYEVTQSRTQLKQLSSSSSSSRNKTTIDPAIPLVGIYPKETITEKNKCIPMFSAALFTIARTWKQPRCSWTNEWIKKLWYTYTMEYYSAIKRNALSRTYIE